MKLSRNIDEFELHNNKHFDFEIDLRQGEGIQNKNQNEERFEVRESNGIKLFYENRNLIERVYKITSTIESRFDDNIDYVSCKETVKVFKVR